MLLDDVVFLDLETTGGSALFDRIIEIGLIDVRKGAVAAEWSTLVNPRRRIPRGIQTLTGITDESVSTARSFDELSAELAARLEGRLLAAHNARFDYGFLRHEFARAGHRYRAPVLCTVKLSRTLHPQRRRHNLDALLVRHAIFCLDRHRALGDARVLWELAQVWRRKFAPEALESVCAEASRAPSIPPALAPTVLDAIPETPGTYVLYGENDAVLYVGRSANLQARVSAHFRGPRRGKDAHIAAQVRRIDWSETLGELGALMTHLRNLQKLTPVYNRVARRRQVKRTPKAERVHPWPYAGCIGVRERNAATDQTELHVLDRWCYLGTARSESDLDELLACSVPENFDLHTYKVLFRFLKSPPRDCEIVAIAR